MIAWIMVELRSSAVLFLLMIQAIVEMKRTQKQNELQTLLQLMYVAQGMKMYFLQTQIIF